MQCEKIDMSAITSKIDDVISYNENAKDYDINEIMIPLNIISKIIYEHLDSFCFNDIQYAVARVIKKGSNVTVAIIDEEYGIVFVSDFVMSGFGITPAGYCPPARALVLDSHCVSFTKALCKVDITTTYVPYRN